MTFKLLKMFPKYFFHQRKNNTQLGFATGTAMIILMIVMSIAISIYMLTQKTTKQDLQIIRFHDSVALIQANIFNFGQNYPAYKATVINNKTYTTRSVGSLGTPQKRESDARDTPYTYSGGASMTCILNNTTFSLDGCGNVEEPIALFWPDGTTYYDQFRVGYNGFRLDGTVCNYDPNNHDEVVDGCVIQVQLTWVPFCKRVTCQPTDYKVLFNMNFITPKYVKYNTAFPALSVLAQKDLLPVSTYRLNATIPIFNKRR